MDENLFAAVCAGDASRVARLLSQGGGGANANARNAIRDTPLVVACHGGHSAVVDALLAAGADPNAAYKFGASPLAVAAELGDARIVRALLAAGARVDHTNTWGATALHAAASGGFVEVAQLLVKAGADDRVRDKTGTTPLQEAERHGHAEIAHLLLGNKRTVSVGGDEEETLEQAVACGDVDMVRALVLSGASLSTVARDGCTLLHRAVSSKDVAMVAYLLSEQVDVDAMDLGGWTPLHHAVRTRARKIVEVLLGHGADVNRQTRGRRGEQTTRYEATPLHLAVHADDGEILDLLLGRETIDLNLRNDQGRTPLVYAVSLDRNDAVSRLLHDGADVNARADAGESALLVACYRGRDDNVHALLQAGARVDVIARSGRTPLSVAKSREHRDVLELYHKSQQFHDQCFVWLGGQSEPPTLSTLTSLVPLLTSVYDLRHLPTLVAMCEDPMGPGAVRELLAAAFHHVVDHKPTFDDDACVFFKLCLERCEREKLLPRQDVLLLDRKAKKVNTESADWVVEMKRHVSSNSWRLDANEKHLESVVSGLHELHGMVVENRKSRLRQSEATLQSVASSLQQFRDAYVDRVQQEERKAKLKRVVGIVASIAGFVFAPLLKEVGDAVVDFVNPIDILEKVYGESDIVAFLGETSTAVLPEKVQAQLEKYAMPTDAFETLLREEIVWQHPEYMDECTRRGLTLNADGGRSDDTRRLEPSLKEEESVVLEMVEELPALCALSSNSPDVLQSTPHASSNGDLIVHQKTNLLTASRINGEGTRAVPYHPSHAESVQAIMEAVVRATPLTPAPTASHGDVTIVFVDDLDAFDYHSAVHESGGRLSEFPWLLQRITDAGTSDLSATMAMQLHTCTTSQETLCAAQYAYKRGYAELGDFLAAQTQSAIGPYDKTPAGSIKVLEDPEAFAAICAVDESHGNVHECKRFLDVVVDDHEYQEALTAAIRATVVSLTSQSVQWTAVEYACQLGYEAIVSDLLRDVYKATLPTRTKLQLLKSVRDRASTVHSLRISDTKMK